MKINQDSLVILFLTGVKISIQKKESVLLMDYKEDIRIQKTRRDLRNAIIELIKEKPIEKISVTEICDVAMVNRMTFYKYYEDKFTLLDDTVNEIKDELESKLPEYKTITTIDEASVFFANVVKNVIDYIEKNKDLVIAVQKNGDYKLFDIITYISESAITELLTQIDKIKKLKYSIPLSASFIYGGFVSAISYGIEHPDLIDSNQLLKFIDDIKNNLYSLDFLFK